LRYRTLAIPCPGRQLGLKRGIVFFDKLIKECPFRAMAFVSDNAAARTRFPASR